MLSYTVTRLLRGDCSVSFEIDPVTAVFDNSCAISLKSFTVMGTQENIQCCDFTVVAVDNV
jgi:hypothetical protein